VLAVYPPLEAYRRDVARLGERRSLGPVDDRWLTTAMLLQRYADGSAEERKRLAPDLARQLAAESELTVSSAGLRVANDILDAGGLHLAATWLSLLERIIPDDRALDIGRVRAHRARVARQFGAMDAAHDLYADVERLGEASAEPELTARAWIGYAVLTQTRGNYPDARRWYQAAALVADDALCFEQSFHAHQGLMVCCAVGRDFDQALIEGWKAYEFSQGDGSREVEVLVNIAQILYDTGRHAAALRGFAAAVARTEVPRILLHALGGVALAAARMDQGAIVQAAADRIERVSGPWLHPFAYALVDLACAFAVLGDRNAATTFRDRARALAEKHGFHELVHRADAVESLPAESAPRVTFSHAAAGVVDNVESLDAPPDLCVA
jgi:tetratricopeptide (TPR) repeat protein